MRLPKISRLKHECNYGNVIVVNYIYRFNFVEKLQCFQRLVKTKKKNFQRVLVLNLVEISKDQS